MISIAEGQVIAPQTGVLVLLVDNQRQLTLAAADINRQSKGQVSSLLEAEKTLKNGQVIDIPSGFSLGHDRILLLILEDKGTVELEQAGAKLAAKCQALKIDEAYIANADGLKFSHHSNKIAEHLAMGLQLRAYAFDRYKTVKEGDEPKTSLSSILFQPSKAGEKPNFEAVTKEAEAVAFTRDLVSEPANVLTPSEFKERLKDLDKLGLEIEVLSRKEMEDEKMGALLAVAQGSEQPPFTVIMRWPGSQEHLDEKPVVLVGKGVCFDTGGISLKPAGGMEMMKWDMAGAGAISGAMFAIASRNCPLPVIGIVGLVENMPSGKATRPGDVITSMAGKTVEVINTDAEGRLVLADLLHLSRTRFEPRLMVDAATLTGAVIVALGHEQAGLFANDEELAKGLSEAGEGVGEKLWRLPLGEEYKAHIKSQIADIKNTGRGREAGSTAGAIFLEEFVGDTPWAHLDIAGVAFAERDRSLTGKGATGFGVRLLNQFVKSLEDQENAST